MRVPDELIQFIEREKRFFIATHINPEGDALGSSLALAFALESMGKEAIVYDRDPVPESYRFLPGHERFTTSLSPLAAGVPLVLVDCNEPGRAGIDSTPISFSAVIDHHETEKEFGQIKWVVPGAAATGVMVFALLKKLGVEVTRDMATNLYTALAIDTGTFRYSNVTSGVLRDAAELVDIGADPAAVAEGLYETWTGGRFSLLIDVLNTLEISDGLAITVATREMFMRTGTSAPDTENFANMPRMIKDTRVSAFFRETDDGWKVSLRSRGKVNVAQVAAGFRGGGHRNAAGYFVRGDLQKAKEALRKAMKSCGV
jgi:phosphoesterase RecJ-like protein